MRESYNEIQEKGAEVVAIGMGTPEMAAHFRDDQAIPFPLLVDRRKETYRALEIKRGTLLDILGPQVWLRGATSILSGNRQGRARQDPLQLGGAVVAAPGGDIRFVHRATNSSDNVPVRELIDALP